MRLDSREVRSIFVDPLLNTSPDFSSRNPAYKSVSAFEPIFIVFAGALTRMNQSSSNPFILQRTSPLPDQHIERSSGDTVCIIQTRHSCSKFDRPECRGNEDKFLPLAGTNEREERSDHDAVVDNFEL